MVNKKVESNRVLHIFMNEHRVGKLEKTAEGALMFVYEESWINMPGARSISFSLPLTTKPFIGDVVYDYFDNLLPDNIQIRRSIQSRFKASTGQPFDLLACIGRDCVGAIQLLETKNPNFQTEMDYHPLKEKEIAEILRNIKQHPLGMSDEAKDFRISIAGAQEKTALLYWKNKWNRPAGTTPTTHIFKLPMGFLQHHQIDLSESCENEWLCAQIAEAFGFAVAKCEIQMFQDTKALIVERFDRKLASNGETILRLPQEDMCQALGFSPNLKYQSDGGPGIQQIMNLLQGSQNAIKDRDTFFRAQILFFLLAAIDGHAKNFSIHIEAESKFRLTPLYDIISVYPLIAQGQLQAKRIKMAMALKGKSNHYHWGEIQRRHFLSMAEAAKYPAQRANQMIDDMLDQVDSVIESVSAKLPQNIPTHIVQPIFMGMQAAKKRLLK